MIAKHELERVCFRAVMGKYVNKPTKQLLREAQVISRQVPQTPQVPKVLSSHKPLSLNRLEVTMYSTCSMRRKETVTTQCDGLSLVDVKGYVTALYDEHWWLGYVMDVIPADEEAELNFHHHIHGPSSSHCYLRHSDPKSLCE